MGPFTLLSSRPAYIAGVTNPIFEAGAWDLFLTIGAGTVTVAKDIHTTYPVTPNASFGAPLISRTGTLKAESSIGSEDDIGRSGKEGGNAAKTDNNADKVFIEDVCIFNYLRLPSPALLTVRTRSGPPLRTILVRAS